MKSVLGLVHASLLVIAFNGGGSMRAGIADTCGEVVSLIGSVAIANAGIMGAATMIVGGSMLQVGVVKNVWASKKLPQWDELRTLGIGQTYILGGLAVSYYTRKFIAYHITNSRLCDRCSEDGYACW